MFKRLRYSVLCGMLCASVGCSRQEPPAKAPAQVAEASSPEPVPAPPRIKKGLSPKQISPVVKSHYGEVSGCHAVGSGKTGDDSEGSLVVGWVITPDGSVRSPQVLESSFDNDEVARCVLQIAQTLKFPEASDYTEVSWKFRFKARGQGLD